MIDTFWLINNTPFAMEQSRNIVEMHRNVCTMTGGSRADRGVLWALDHRRVLIIRSHDMPDIQLVNDAFLHHGETEPFAAYQAQAPVHESFDAGDVYRFDLHASPTRRLNHSNRDEAMHSGDWLAFRSDTNGFHLRNLTWRTYTARGGGRGKQIVFPVAAYSGELVITDGELFAAMMHGGIGRKRAYGMGLMTLSRLANSP